MAKLTDPGFDWRAQLARPGVGETPRARPLPRRRLSELIRGDDRMADEGLILAVAELSFPRAHLRFVTGLIAGIAGVHARHQSSKPDTNGSR